MSSPRVQVLIADDHPVLRVGLRQIIAGRRGWAVAAEASTADEVLSALRRKHVDVVTLGITLGGRSTLDLISQIAAEFPSRPVLVVSSHPEEQYALRCLRAGALGYIQKDRSPEEILEAIERVAMRRRYVSASVAEQLAAAVLDSAPAEPYQRLSSREFEVFRLIGSGKTGAEIASLLHLSAKTVSTYRARILLKTGFRSNAEIISYAVRNGLV